MQFRVDGANVGAEDLTAPYSISWDTHGDLNGSHTLTAVARDTSGNTATSVSVPGDRHQRRRRHRRACASRTRSTRPRARSLRTRPATISPATTVGSTWTAGQFGGAASFDGVSDRIDVPALGTFYTTGFTYEAWVRKQTSKKDVAVLGSWNSNGPMIWVDHIAGHYYLTLGGSMSSYLDSGRTPTVGQWEHVAATYDGSVARFYVGGVQVASTTFSLRRRQLEHLAPGRLRRQPDRLLRRTRSTTSASTTAPLSAAEIQADMASRDSARVDPADRDREDPGRRARAESTPAPRRRRSSASR